VDGNNRSLLGIAAAYLDAMMSSRVGPRVVILISSGFGVRSGTSLFDANER
jgi:hypothetical protein